MKRELICIACPKGCHVTVEDDPNAETGYSVSGYTCKQGLAYALKEVTAPERTLTTTVKISGACIRRLPVITDGSIPKEKLFQAMRELDQVEVEAPVEMGAVILPHIAQTDINVIASRSLGRKDGET